MPLLLRRDKGVKLTKDELDNNLVFLKDYTNLINKPFIPSKVSDVENDTGFVTAAGARTAINAGNGITYDNSTGTITVDTSVIATMSYVDTAIGNIIGSAPDTLNTLKELADAINDSRASMMKVLIGTAGTVVAGVLSTLIVVLSKMS